MKNDARLQIRCKSDWYEKLKAKAEENGESLTNYVTTCIALGECVREGIVIQEDSDEIQGNSKT